MYPYISLTGPNSIRANQNISFGSGPICKIDSDTVSTSLTNISFDWISILDKIGFNLFAFSEENFLQIRTINDTYKSKVVT
jgi:hypothetical protein